MPELPEVETQVRDLQILVGKKILDVVTDTPKSFRPDFVEFSRKVKNKKIFAISRRAKFLVFALEKNLQMVVHFRMTGHFLLARNFVPLEKYVRHFFKISGGIILQFSDIRKFATFELIENNSTSRSLEKLGIEPLEREFTFPKFREIIKKKKGKLKAFLLDQKNVVGIGNIYADEICFASGIHPVAEIQNLSDESLKNIHREIKKQLRKGIRNRGTTIGEFVDTCGISGRNQNSLVAYRRYGLPCKICGMILRKMKISQRTTSFCPHCQRKI